MDIKNGEAYVKSNIYIPYFDLVLPEDYKTDKDYVTIPSNKDPVDLPEKTHIDLFLDKILIPKEGDDIIQPEEDGYIRFETEISETEFPLLMDNLNIKIIGTQYNSGATFTDECILNVQYGQVEDKSGLIMDIPDPQVISQVVIFKEKNENDKYPARIYLAPGTKGYTEIKINCYFEYDNPNTGHMINTHFSNWFDEIYKIYYFGEVNNDDGEPYSFNWDDTDSEGSLSRAQDWVIYERDLYPGLDGFMSKNINNPEKYDEFYVSTNEGIKVRLYSQSSSNK